jgi:23S rRNA pseudouridine1911/1915/1917 synthase
VNRVELLWDDPPCLVVNKPGGLLTQSPPGIDSLEDRVRAFEKQRRGVEGNIYLGLPHRLDRPASGAIVFARNIRATRRLCEQFAGRLVEKRYWVLVEGEPDAPAGTWRDVLRKLPGQPHVEVVAPSDPEGRLAILHYRRLGGGPYGSWLEIQLETGRTHQIRVQCASRGLPVVGDSQYGARQTFGPPTTDWRRRWIALHARQLAFAHPKTGQRVVVTAPVPSAWQDFTPPGGWPTD